MIVLDTNFIIYWLNKEQKIVEIFRDFFIRELDIGVSFITKIELLSFPHLSSREKKNIMNFLEFVDVIMLNNDILDSTIQIRSKKKIDIPDAIIAATAISYKAPIYTRNIKDFRKITGLQVVKI